MGGVHIIPERDSKKNIVQSVEAFRSKYTKEGSLFRRKHGYKITIPAGQEQELLINVPYDKCKINKLEVIGANSLDRIDLMVLDTPTGTITSTLTATGFTAIPNFMLNQFGFDVVVSDFLYSDKSDYDADLIKDMKIKVVYKNDSANSVTVGINIIFHEIKV